MFHAPKVWEMIWYYIQASYFSVFLFFFEVTGDTHVVLHELFWVFWMIRSYWVIKVYKFKVGLSPFPRTVSILKVKAIAYKTNKGMVMMHLVTITQLSSVFFLANLYPRHSMVYRSLGCRLLLEGGFKHSSTRNPGEMIQFVIWQILFRWVGSTTN